MPNQPARGPIRGQATFPGGPIRGQATFPGLFSISSLSPYSPLSGGQGCIAGSGHGAPLDVDVLAAYAGAGGGKGKDGLYDEQNEEKSGE